MAAFAAPSAHGSELWLAAVGREGFDPEALVRRYMELYPRRSRPTVMQVKAIPRNAMGKVQRSALRELAERAIQAAATKH